MKHRKTLLIVGAALYFAWPAFTAAASAPLVDLRAAPVSPSQLTDGKKDDVATLLLRAASREGVTDAEGFDALLVRQQARDAALITLLGPDSPTTHAVARALRKKLGGLFGGAVAPEHADAIALQMVQSIFLNRRDDLTATQALYADARWKKALRERLGGSPALNVILHADKRAELKNTALYIHTPGNPAGKIEPAVHLLLTALAQQLGHAALAELTADGTPLHAHFTTALGKALPDDPAANAWLDDWLTLRSARAAAVAEDFRLDGALVQEAIAESETTRRARLAKPPAITYTR